VYEIQFVSTTVCLKVFLYGIEGDAVDRFPHLSGAAERATELGAATGTAVVLLAVLAVEVHSNRYSHHQPRNHQPVHYEADHHHVAKGVQISVDISPKQFLYGFRVLVEVNRADDEVQEGDDKKSYARIFALDSRSQTVPDEGASATTRVAPAPLAVTAATVAQFSLLVSRFWLRFCLCGNDLHLHWLHLHWLHLNLLHWGCRRIGSAMLNGIRHRYLPVRSS